MLLNSGMKNLATFTKNFSSLHSITTKMIMLYNISMTEEITSDMLFTISTITDQTSLYCLMTATI